MMGAMLSNGENREEVVEMLGKKALTPQALVPEKVQEEVKRVESALTEIVEKAKTHVKTRTQDKNMEEI